MMPALFILIAALLAQSAPTATGTIRGHVLEDGSNKPVVGARVLLFSQGGPPIGGPPRSRQRTRTARSPSLLSCREITGSTCRRTATCHGAFRSPVCGRQCRHSFMSKPVSRRLPICTCRKAACRRASARCERRADGRCTGDGVGDSSSRTRGECLRASSRRQDRDSRQTISASFASRPCARPVFIAASPR